MLVPRIVRLCVGVHTCMRVGAVMCGCAHACACAIVFCLHFYHNFVLSFGSTKNNSAFDVNLKNIVVFALYRHRLECRNCDAYT